MIGDFPAVLNFNRLYLKLNRFICTQLPVLPDPWCEVTHMLVTLPTPYLYGHKKRYHG